MFIIDWFRKPDTIVEVYKKQKYWRAIDFHNHEVLCHSETYSSSGSAMDAGEKFADRLKKARLIICP